jgi:hypothetical protein
VANITYFTSLLAVSQGMMMATHYCVGKILTDNFLDRLQRPLAKRVRAYHLKVTEQLDQEVRAILIGRNERCNF